MISIFQSHCHEIQIITLKHDGFLAAGGAERSQKTSHIPRVSDVIANYSHWYDVSLTSLFLAQFPISRLFEHSYGQLYKHYTRKPTSAGKEAVQQDSPKSPGGVTRPDQVRILSSLTLLLSPSPSIRGSSSIPAALQFPCYTVQFKYTPNDFRSKNDAHLVNRSISSLRPANRASQISRFPSATNFRLLSL